MGKDSHMTKSKMNEKNSALYNWLFHYNPYDECWHAFVREDYIGYFGSVKPLFPDFKSPKISVLTEIILKCEGDPKQVAQYIEEI